MHEKNMKKLTIVLLLVISACAGCDKKKTMDFSVTSMAVLPQGQSVVFTFPANAGHDALVIKGIKEDVIQELSTYLTKHHKSITNAVTYGEVWDVKFLRSPQHTAKSYHISIRLDRSLAPGEFGRSFSLDGAYDAISFVEIKEAEGLLSKGDVIQLKSVPHELHYMSRKVRSPGKHVPGP